MRLVSIYKGPVKEACHCGDWRAHFNKHSTQWIIWCSEFSCTRVAIHGTLIQLNDKRNSEIYIVPLCHLHAQSIGPIDIGNVIPINSRTDSCRDY